MKREDIMLDVVIVGGSAAGLSAALYLGRMRRKVVIFDTGTPCNRFSHASHGFLTRDGTPPAELLQLGREQLQPYTTISFRAEAVTAIVPQADGFQVTIATGSYRARKILLATGLRDELPLLSNVAQFWGQSVFHCPYCDGWEWRDQPLAVYGNGDQALHIAKLVRNLTADLAICTGEGATFSAEDRHLLAANGIRLIETPVVGLEGTGGQLATIHFADGAQIARRALYLAPKLVQQSDLAARLGCTLTEDGFVQVDASMQTSLPGVYAAGDMTKNMRQIVAAAAQGATAGGMINMVLSNEDFQR
jgi:thioredoxin reductase